MPKIKFINEKQEVEVQAGTNLRDAALQNNIEVHHHGVGNELDGSAKYLNCSLLSDLAKKKLGKDATIASYIGGGTCGTCHVYIKNGYENCNPPTLKEKARFAVAMFDIGHEKEVRLACQTTVNGDIEVETRPKANLYGEKFWQ